MSNKILWSIVLIVLLLIMGCKSKVQESSSAPTADATPKAMEQMQAPADSQDQSAQDMSTPEQSNEQATDASVGETTEEITAQAGMSTPVEEDAPTSQEPQSEAPESSSNDSSDTK